MAFGAAEALAELDRLVQDHFERRPGLGRKLVAADVQDRPLDRREPLEGPVEVRGNQRLQLGAALENPAHDPLRELLVRVLEAVQSLHLLERIAVRQLPRVQRLQGHFPRLAPRFLHCGFTVEALSLAISRATRTASAPLSRRALACASSSVVRMPLATGRPHCSATSMTPRADSLATISK